jgi:hypothetical protein
LSRNKTICSIPRDWTLEDYRAHTCSDGSHHHITRAELKPSEDKGLVIWMHEAQNRRDRSVVYVLPDRPGPQTKSYGSNEPINSGLSNAVGEELAMDVYKKEPYAEVMLAHIRMRRESPACSPEF